MSARDQESVGLEQLEPRLLLSGDPLVAARIIDDGAAGFGESGSWQVSNAGGYGADFLSGPGAAETASWTFDGLTPGYRYSVSTTWVAGSDRTAGALYTITDVLNSETHRVRGDVEIDQTTAPNDFSESGVLWEELGGPYLVRGTTLSIDLSSAGPGVIVADAIRIERVGQWVAPIGVPTPEFGIEESHWMYADPSYTYDYGSGDEA